jgi:hypothetical protein
MRVASWISLQNEGRVVLASKGTFTAVATDLLYEMMAAYISAIAVDEAWYLDANPDVAAAVRQGALSGAMEHYVQSGYFENRMPYGILVDEAWYRGQYEDVDQAVALGTFQSAQEHFETVGYAEGRHPYAGFALRVIG